MCDTNGMIQSFPVPGSRFRVCVQSSGSKVRGSMFMFGVPCPEPRGAAEFLASDPAKAESFLWLHFTLANAASEPWPREHVALPETCFESLHDSTSTRVEHLENALVAVLNDVAYYDVSSVSRVSACAHPHILVSARTTALRSLDRLRASVRAGETFRSPSELLAHLLRDQADVLVQIVRDATREVDGMEDRLMTSVAALNRAKLGSMRRVLVRLRRLIAPEPAALFRLLNRPPSFCEPISTAPHELGGSITLRCDPSDRPSATQSLWPRPSARGRSRRPSGSAASSGVTHR